MTDDGLGLARALVLAVPAGALLWMVVLRLVGWL